MKTLVNTNEEYKGIELYFEGMPYGKTRAILKVNGFRWHNQKKCWYAKDTNERRKIALQVAKREESHEIEPLEAVKVEKPAVLALPAPVDDVIDVEAVEVVEPENEPVKVSSLGVVIEDKPKKARKTATEKAFEALKKAAPHMVAWNGSFDGKTYACDGYSLMITTETVADAPELIKADADRMDGMRKATEDATTKVYKLDFTAKELRAGISQLKNGKRKAKVAYVFEDGGLMINADFLLRAMETTGACEVLWNTEKSPVCLKNETTFFLICPVNNSGKASRGLHII